MYEYISGILREKGDDCVILECAGVGYLLHVSGSTLAALETLEIEVKLYTHLLHREDAMELYGFAARAERELFRKLLSINGVGAKQAHKILCGMDYRRFVEAVLADDIRGMTAIPGLGKKRAEKIVFELKDRISSLSAGDAGVSPAQAVPEEAVLALEALGFSGMLAKSAVRRAVKEVDSPGDIQALIRAALRHV